MNCSIAFSSFQQYQSNLLRFCLYGVRSRFLRNQPVSSKTQALPEYTLVENIGLEPIWLTPCKGIPGALPIPRWFVTGLDGKT